MKKQLTCLLIASACIIASAPAVTTSATANTAIKNPTSTIKASSSWKEGYILAGTELYYRPYSDCYYGFVGNKELVDIKYYGDGWYKVRIGPDNEVYYVYGSGHLIL